MILSFLITSKVILSTASDVNGIYDIGNETNPDFDSLWASHATIATSTYERLKHCLTFDRKYRFVYPRDAEEHFEELKCASTKYRGLEPHTGQGYYREKWIENYFIDSFSDRPLSEFSGLFPLFVETDPLPA